MHFKGQDSQETKMKTTLPFIILIKNMLKL
jgi:hypothetical protein